MALSSSVVNKWVKDDEGYEIDGDPKLAGQSDFAESVLKGMVTSLKDKKESVNGRQER